ncbi:unnamed protein product [Ixodes persulcatus]
MRWSLSSQCAATAQRSSSALTFKSAYIAFVPGYPFVQVPCFAYVCVAEYSLHKILCTTPCAFSFVTSGLTISLRLQVMMIATVLTTARVTILL